jgi:23S rRNA (cytosine1962-C5)-methyltransferase
MVMPPSSSKPPAGKRPALPSSDTAAANPLPADLQSPWVRLRSVAYHPFIYQRMVDQIDPAAQAGDLVHVYDRRGALFGHGLLNPRSQIVLRMVAYGQRPVDAALWQSRAQRAVDLRQRLRLDETTDAYRVVHAEGDELGGLIVERYGDALVCEVFSLGIHRQLDAIMPHICEALGKPSRLERPHEARDSWRIIVRADKRTEQLEGFQLAPERDAAITVIREHGIRYRVDMAGGHKTGFFCDQRENRARLATMCRDSGVLDMCCYSGGFGLAAKVLGGAREVTSVDLDEQAIDLAKQNANLNQTRIHHVHADAYNYLRQMIAIDRTFDVVVLDPPKFCPTRRDVEQATARYHDLNKLGMQCVRDGGLLLTCSCSGLISGHEFEAITHRAARVAGRRLQHIATTGAAPDHPVMTNCPESAYLKAIWYRVLA